MSLGGFVSGQCVINDTLRLCAYAETKTNSLSPGSLMEWKFSRVRICH